MKGNFKMSIEFTILLVLALVCIFSIFLLWQETKKNKQNESDVQNSIKLLGSMISDNLSEKQSEFDKKVIETFHNIQAQQEKINSMYLEQLKNFEKNSVEKQTLLKDTLSQNLKQFEERFKTFSVETEQKLENIRNVVGEKLQIIRDDNNKKLDEMKDVVDRKLSETLNKRMTESFKLVNDRLQEVYKGLGEMQNLAKGVGDLKKVLSNVKSRGVLGEIQLGAILEEILSPEQYEKNVATKKGSQNVVEYAVKLPVNDEECVYLPIDSKFPGDTYANLRDAYESGNADAVQRSAKALIDTLKKEARDIRDKYIDVPNTTDFAIMFLPFEGLYSEVVNRGLIETLQRDFKVNVAGPSTMAALLNSLQMGFRTFAIQKRSHEVWNVLGAVKTEFDKFSDVLVKALDRLNQASGELDKLVGVRTRQIQRKLKDVTKLGDLQTREIFMSDKEELPEVNGHN